MTLRNFILILGTINAVNCGALIAQHTWQAIPATAGVVVFFAWALFADRGAGAP